MTNVGTRKRVHVYGRSREEVHKKLTQEQSKADRGIPAPAQGWRLDAYLDYWLVRQPHLVP